MDAINPLEIVKQKIRNKLKRIFRRFVIMTLILVIVVGIISASVGEVFKFFNPSLGESLDGIYDTDIEEVIKWADGLSEMEIRKIMKSGSSIHPRKFKKYLDVEKNSYPKDVTIKIPVETTTNGRTSIKYIDYTYRVGETAYPYRQWWQSIAVLDVVNQTGENINMNEMINSASSELKPEFFWGDPETLSYKNGSKYKKTSKYESVTTIKTTTRTTVERISGGEGDNLSGPSGGITTETVKTYQPLPFLDSVDTMFGLHEFEYKQENKKNPPKKFQTTETYIERINKTTDDGFEEQIEVKYRITTHTTVESESQTWVLKDNQFNNHEKFTSFLENHDLDSNDDPYIMGNMAESLPQNGDFLAELNNYLDFMDGIQSNGGVDFDDSWDGDFGDYGGGIMAWPVPGFNRISSPFGYRIHPILGTRKLHTGIDIPATNGKPVIAVEDGTVTTSGRLGTYGNTVMINHGGGIVTLYAHNSVLIARRGQKVKKGDVIARIGSTGRSTGPHLHFEVRKNGSHVNPVPWIR